MDISNQEKQQQQEETAKEEDEENVGVVNNNSTATTTSSSTSTSTSSSSSSSSSSSTSLHRRRILYLLRHGQAIHNVKESEAQEKAKKECIDNGIIDEKIIKSKMEKARQDVLHDQSLFDAQLTENGKEQVHETGKILQKLITDGIIPKPTEAMVSPLSRCLQTASIILNNYVTMDDGEFIRATIRPELRERQTLYPPDTPKPIERLLRYTEYSKFLHHTSIDELALTGDELINEEETRDEEEEVETRMMLRERASKLFNLIIDTKFDTNILLISHKGYLREMERGLLGLSIDNSPLFNNAELRIYDVTFTRGDRQLNSVKRLY